MLFADCLLVKNIISETDVQFEINLSMNMMTTFNLNFNKIFGYFDYVLF